MPVAALTYNKFDISVFMLYSKGIVIGSHLQESFPSILLLIQSLYCSIHLAYKLQKS